MPPKTRSKRNDEDRLDLAYEERDEKEDRKSRSRSRSRSKRHRSRSRSRRTRKQDTFLEGMTGQAYASSQAGFAKWFDSKYRPAAERHGWKDQQIRDNVFMYMTDDARAILTEHRNQLKGVQSDEKLKEMVNGYLHGKQWVLNLRKAAMSVKMNPGETVTEYWNRFNELVTEVGKDKFTESDLVLYWVSGIKDSLRLTLHSKDHKTLHDAMMDAKGMDEVNNSPSSPSSTAAVMVVTDKKCDHCGKTNHRTSACWKCYNCNERGHKSSHCNKRGRRPGGGGANRRDFQPRDFRRRSPDRRYSPRRRRHSPPRRRSRSRRRSPSRESPVHRRRRRSSKDKDQLIEDLRKDVDELKKKKND